MHKRVARRLTVGTGTERLVVLHLAVGWDLPTTAKGAATKLLLYRYPLATTIMVPNYHHSPVCCFP
jgi:hypothetical protein